MLKGFLFIISTILLALIPLQAITVADFKANSTDVESLSDPIMSITADDGMLFYLCKVNKIFTDQRKLFVDHLHKPVPIEFSIGVFGSEEVFTWVFVEKHEYSLPIEHGTRYAIVDSTKKHILYMFNHEDDYFEKDNQRTFEITKIEEFERVTSYNLSLKFAYPKEGYNSRFYEHLELSETLWLDREGDYSGSYQSPFIPFLPVYASDFVDYKFEFINGDDGTIKLGTFTNRSGRYELLIDFDSKDLEDHYFALKELFVEYLNTRLSLYKKVALDGYHFLEDENFSNILNLMKVADRATWEIWDKEYMDVKILTEDTNDFLVVEDRLENYTKFIDDLVAEYSVKYIDFLDVDDDRMIALNNKPDIKGQLPTSEEELAIYLDWVYDLTQWSLGGDEHDNKLYDRYENEIKFELILGGLKATSAGYDRVFDTDDDIWAIRYLDGKFEKHPKN